ncbi:MAG: DUF4185 domain-containing protein [Polyangiaceae bacterium]
MLPRASILICWSCLAGCGGGPNPVLSVNEIGSVPNPPLCTARDVGFSAVLDGRSVWVFGDTLFTEPAADGFQWRSATWSWTSAAELGDFSHALGDDGKPRQLLPNTAEETAFNVEHKAEPRRHTPWPQALVSDGSRAVLFYVNMVTGPGGAWDFDSVSGSIAIWDDADEPALRVEPPLFGDDEPDWGSAAVLMSGEIFAYACNETPDKACKLARVPFDKADQRDAYRFYDGQAWVRDWHQATRLFDGAPLFSVHWSEHLKKLVAIYMQPGGNEMRIRTATKPEGPWSDYAVFGEGAAPAESFDYALIAHPELAREDGAVEVLSYTRPSGFLAQETRLVELRWR